MNTAGAAEARSVTDDDCARAPRASLLVPGETCWRRVHAARVAFLVDGEAYYGALADALERAERSVLLIGWDFHSRVELRPGRPGPESAPLAELLDRLARARRRLQIHVLAWDFALLYSLERQILPLLQFGARTHRRVHFELDPHHPVTACHHQKIAVVDDSVAFVGGFDLTVRRWDTRAHAPEDPRRTYPGGGRYGPFHDVQMAVDRQAAAALGALARERWRRATGQRLRPPPAGLDAWPPALEPDLRDAEVGVARTEPAHDGAAEVREIEALTLRSIAAARRFLYVENQYLTSARVVDALAARLAEPGAPEVVVVGPERCSGWLEESTMGALRSIAVQRLREADRHDRLRLYTPHLPGLPAGQCLNLHAKLMVVDDELVRIGSSNLSNRSLGLDTECDLAVEAGGRRSVRDAIALFRDGLLAEHLGVAAAQVASALRERGSLIAAIESLRSEGRSLRPLAVEPSPWIAGAVAGIGVADPEHPAPLEDLLDRVAADRESPLGGWRSRSARALFAALAAVALAGLWKLTPLSEWAEPSRLAAALPHLHGAAGAFVGVWLFAAATLVMLPVTVLIVAAALVLGVGWGILVSLAGSLIGAALGYLAGRLLWRDTVRRIAGRRLARLSRRIARRGVSSTAVVRLAPVAPFQVLNLVAGASHVGLADFLAGTLIGMAPGTVILSVGADRLVAALREPSPWRWAAVAVIALAGGALLAWLGILARRGGSRPA
jgi:phospholipase D1/2